MKKKTKYKFFKIIIAWAFLLILPLTVSATDWYVRPAGQGSYGAQNGTDYDNAWDGLLNIVWDSGGVQPGDNLYVCGLHVHNMTNKGSVVGQANVYPISGTDENNRVTIRGDCPNDPGVVWSTFIPSYEPWVHNGSNVWSMTLPGDTHRGNIFEDTGVPSVDSYKLMQRVSSFAECAATPSSHYSIDYEGRSRIYVHTSNSGDPTGRVTLNRWGYEFYLNDGTEYVTFLNLKMFAPYRYEYRGRPNVKHIRFQNCTLWYGESRILTFGDGNDYMDVLDCDIGYSSTPIYLISSTPNSPANYVFARNEIHHCGWLEFHQSGDMHAMGIQGGSGGLVEDNYIHHCTDGIVYYNYPGMDGYNITVRRNYLADFNYKVDPQPFGISFGSNAIGALGDTSGNEIYNNVIVGAYRALYYKWSEPVKIYNNIVINAVDAFRFSGNDVSATKVELKNNIAYNVSDHFIYYRASPDNTYSIQSDNNIFYPVQNGKFYFQNSSRAITADFNQWKALSAPNCIFDPNSLTDNPLFVDVNARDYHLQSGSPAIDAGVDVWFTSDFEGNPVPQGNAPDVGAFESDFLSGGASCDIDGDVNGDCNVTIIDLILVADDFGKTSGYNSRADTDGNQVIDIFDVVYVARRIT